MIKKWAAYELKRLKIIQLLNTFHRKKHTFLNNVLTFNEKQNPIRGENSFVLYGSNRIVMNYSSLNKLLLHHAAG